jgi:hypothetical protein
MVPTMLRSTATIALAIAAVSGCSGPNTGSGQPSAEAPTSTTAPPTAAPSPTTGGAAQGAALAIPGTTKGEVSRTVLRAAGTGTSGSSNSSTIGEPVKGRSYVVRSACSAPDAATVTVTYRLVDARADSVNRTPEERTAMSAQTPCDGQQHMDEVGTLAFPVTVEYDGTAVGVDTAYTIVAAQ